MPDEEGVAMPKLSDFPREQWGDVELRSSDTAFADHGSWRNRSYWSCWPTMISLEAEARLVQREAKSVTCTGKIAEIKSGTGPVIWFDDGGVWPERFNGWESCNVSVTIRELVDGAEPETELELALREIAALRSDIAARDRANGDLILKAETDAAAIADRDKIIEELKESLEAERGAARSSKAHCASFAKQIADLEKSLASEQQQRKELAAAVIAEQRKSANLQAHIDEFEQTLRNGTANFDALMDAALAAENALAKVRGSRRQTSD